MFIYNEILATEIFAQYQCQLPRVHAQFQEMDVHFDNAPLYRSKFS